MPRVLSIQSHVAYGYVGGKAAVFPLQLLGYDVDVVNSVNFSNHSGYGHTGGTKASAAELNRIFDLMEKNELLDPERLLTGYIPSSEPLTAVAELAKKLKSRNPDLIYVLDPVVGDSGNLYVAADVIPIYRSMLPLATVITPNWFEVETLTQVPLVDFPSIQRALRILHTEYKVPNVVVSSIPLHPWLLQALPPNLRPSETTTESSHLLCISSTKDDDDSEDGDGGGGGISKVAARAVPRIPGYFSGVGDLFSALLLGHYHLRRRQTRRRHSSLSAEPGYLNGASPPNGTAPNGHVGSDSHALTTATTLALSITHAVLTFTHRRTLTLPESDRQETDDEADAAEPLRLTRRMRGRELALVQAQHLIAKADVTRFELEPWTGFWV